MEEVPLIIEEKTIEKIPPYLHKLYKDTFMFGTIGLFNTRRERSFYKIEAIIGN